MESKGVHPPRGGESASADLAPFGAPDLTVNGFEIFKARLSRDAQRALLRAVLAVAAEAPLVRHKTPWGKPMSVAMTSAGAVGWTAGSKGYAYAPVHPDTGRPWPAIPAEALAVWRAAAPHAKAGPDSLLINHYGPTARLGLHQDKEEADFEIPVISISLGAPALFRMGGRTRGGPTRSLTLETGDVVVMGGDARLAYHGVDRIKPGGDTLMADAPELGPEGERGRINLTLRRAAPVG